MQILDWEQLDLAARQAALRRPAAINSDSLLAEVRAIVETVRRDGDAALRRYTLQFDGATLAHLQVDASEFAAARAQLAPDALAALRTAIANVTSFHRAQLPTDIRVEIQPGVCCERLVRPIQAVGLYVPAGSAPLPSTAIMLAVPAQLAACPRRVLCTPPRSDGRADPAILVAAQLCGIEQVYKVGGAQAIAAMAYGTESIPKVAKIFGPGNRWVAAAKQFVAGDPDGAALDLPAGPSEVLVLADESADAQFVAADLLAQAEHDPSAQALLVTTAAALAERVAQLVRERAPLLGRNAILRESLQAARLIVVRDLHTAVQIAEQYAPEHLLIQTRAPRELLRRHHHGGFGVPGALDSRNHGRLLQWHQSCVADLRPCARLQWARPQRFPAQHDGAGTERGRPRVTGAGGRAAGAPREPRCPRCRSRVATRGPARAS